MNTKDYKAITEIIINIRTNYIKESQVRLIITKLADYIEKENLKN